MAKDGENDNEGTDDAAEAAKAEVRSLIGEVLDEKLAAFGKTFKGSPQRTTQGASEPTVWQRLFGG